MKYCLKCARIIADNSIFKDMNECTNCNIPFQEDDMTGEMFESLSEIEKQQYANDLFEKIKKSKVFDNNLFQNNLNKYGESKLYQCWWFDKYEELGGKFSARYETDEERKQRLDEQYGKNSPAYRQAVVQNCINAERARKQESSNIPKCPTCSSTNLKKISTTSKAINTIAFGLLGTKRNKTFHCNQCGYEW